MAKGRAEKRKLLEYLSDESLTIEQALIRAGWSPKQARKGVAAIPLDVMSQLPKKAKLLIERGKTLMKDPKNAEYLTIGRLAKNIETGTDKGAQSAKILGSHRAINAWTPDNQTGVIVLNCPQEINMGEMLKELNAAEATDSKTGHWRTIKRADGAEATEWVEGA